MALYLLLHSLSINLKWHSIYYDTLYVSCGTQSTTILFIYLVALSTLNGTLFSMTLYTYLVALSTMTLSIYLVVLYLLLLALFSTLALSFYLKWRYIYLNDTPYLPILAVLG